MLLFVKQIKAFMLYKMLLFVKMTHLVAEELEPLVVGDARGLLARRRRHRHDREEHVDALLAQQALARLRGERAVLRVAHAAVRQRVLHVVRVGAFGVTQLEIIIVFFPIRQI